MSKTLGQIAAEAYEQMGSPDNVDYDEIWNGADKYWRLRWEAAASAIRNAVLEEAAKVADDLGQESYERQLDASTNDAELIYSGAAMRAASIAIAIRALKHGD
jgi:hypothetical protein